jgi:NADPH2:quinone reductase
VQAIVLSSFGPPTLLIPTEVADPIPAPGQVVIQVEVAGITFVETQVRAGRPPNPAMAPRLPAVLGNGVGGVVTSIGAGVDAGLLGSRVISSTGGSGGYAEQVAADASLPIAVPESLALTEAVALLADGRTALALMGTAEVQAEEVVLVEAAAGGVGSLLVQLARNAGATVVAVAGGASKLDLARRLGATIAVDYTQPNWTDAVRSDFSGIDVVFDGVGGEIGRAAFGLLRAGGRLCSYGMASGHFTDVSAEEAAARHVLLRRGAGASPQELLALTRAALAEAAAGWLHPVIGQTFPLAQAALAHAAIESRVTLGKTLLLTGSAR